MADLVSRTGGDDRPFNQNRYAVSKAEYRIHIMFDQQDRDGAAQ